MDRDGSFAVATVVSAGKGWSWRCCTLLDLDASGICIDQERYEKAEERNGIESLFFDNKKCKLQMKRDLCLLYKIFVSKIQNKSFLSEGGIIGEIKNV